MRTFRVTTTSGEIDIKADVIRFEPGHVTFWKGFEAIGHKQTLVRAIHNPAIEQIRELESAGQSANDIELLDVSIQELADSDDD